MANFEGEVSIVSEDRGTQKSHHVTVEQGHSYEERASICVEEFIGIKLEIIKLICSYMHACTSIEGPNHHWNFDKFGPWV